MANRIGFLGAEIGALVDYLEGKRLDSAQILDQVTRRSQRYAQAGLCPGERVLIAHGNNYHFFLDLFALWELGICCIPLDQKLTLPETINLAQHAGARALVYRKTVNSDALKKALGHAFLLFDTEAPLPAVETKSLPEITLNWDAEALILYTSGSTGQPKGVVHSFRSLMARISLLRGHVERSRLERSLILLPTHFGHGLICNALYPLLNGKTLIILPPFNLQVLGQLGEIIDREQVSFMSSVPTVWKLALKLSPPPKQKSLKLVHCGSAPLSAALRQQIQAWTGTPHVKNTYGITETGSWLAGTPDEVESFCDGFIGPGWGTELRIVDESTGTVCPPDTSGMVYARTPALMVGYDQRPDLTAEAIKNTWFRTGDIGYLQADGALVLQGRQRHEINKAGLKVYPEDVDLVLERHPEVQEACCFGFEDPIAGQEVGVALVMKPQGDMTQIRQWLKDHLSPHKHPVKWFTVDEIPKTSRGKINRVQVAAYCLNPK